jgi:Membrane-bound lysozyme-inhibitor of c-type lysozyme
MKADLLCSRTARQEKFMRLALIAALIALAGCNTPCPPVDTGPVQVTLSCVDGSLLSVTYTRQPDFAHVVQEGYAPLDLPAASSGSGYRYAREGAELRGRGVEARWTRPGAAETICRIPPAAGTVASPRS